MEEGEAEEEAEEKMGLIRRKTYPSQTDQHIVKLCYVMPMSGAGDCFEKSLCSSCLEAWGIWPIS